MITQVFGARPDYYKQFGLNGHEGIDYGGRAGDPIYAAADGAVKLLALDNGVHSYGTHVRITHARGGQTFETIYAHLSAFADGLAVGDAVRAGQQIGAMGSSGNSTGVHLHFTLKRNGLIVDPAPYFST